MQEWENMQNTRKYAVSRNYSKLFSVFYVRYFIFFQLQNCETKKVPCDL